MKRKLVLLSLLGTFIGVTIWLPRLGRVGNYRMYSYGDILVETGNHAMMVGISVVLAVAVGVPLGIVLTRRWARLLSMPILGAVGLGQAVPSLALIAVMAPILGYNVWAAVFAIFIYGLLPILRNTYSGLRSIDPAILEAARGMGMSNTQITRKVEIPLALPIIVAGIRTSAVITVGTATLAVLVGGSGLGKFIVLGLLIRQPLILLQGAAPVAALAVLVDFLLETGQDLATPRGLKATT